MIKQNNKLNTNTTDQQPTVKNLFAGSLVVIIIAITPLLFYSYKSFPDVKIWETSFFTAETAFRSWFDYTWYLANKIIPLLLLFIWFFTCKHWWHWILLIPIGMYSFQIWGLIQENEGVDEIELYYVFPIMMIVVPSVYLIRAKLFNTLRGTDLKAFEEELGANKTLLQQLKDLFR
ncbi:hypothetical protein N9572_05715 [Flavobacteriaceae bacterium]|nr:hypothetical protein [Flavobacteriaceae bacterium]MDB4225278.1 hypothetical protein [Flavobacteriaceae bacterium]MDC0097974.1 hypothetical protein [Flavobacteriaceae bacterium]